MHRLDEHFEEIDVVMLYIAEARKRAEAAAHLATVLSQIRGIRRVSEAHTGLERSPSDAPLRVVLRTGVSSSERFRASSTSSSASSTSTCVYVFAVTATFR